MGRQTQLQEGIQGRQAEGGDEYDERDDEERVQGMGENL